MKSPAPVDGDTTSSVLLSLLKFSLAEQGIAPQLQTKGLSRATAALSEKESLSDAVLRAHGPEALLAVGQEIPKFRAEPIVSCLLSAKDPSAAIARWVRLQRYAHIKHPARIVVQSDTHVEFLHADIGMGPPSPAADLLLVSVIGALISLTGGEALTVEIGRGAAVTTIYRDGVRRRSPDIAPGCETGYWRFSWTLTQNPVAKGTPVPSLHRRYTDAASALIEEDLLNAWTLQDLSVALNVSSRTLQRRLLDEGTTLSNLVRDARIRRAMALLAVPSHSLGGIGFTCGFSDAAHFARAFRARMGMPPGAYREMVSLDQNSTPPVSPSGVRRSVGP